MKQLPPPRDPVKLPYFTGIKNPFKAHVVLAFGISLITVFALSVGMLMNPSIAKAATTSYYSISHYVSFPTSDTTNSSLSNWAKTDASYMDPPWDGATCNYNYYSRHLIVVLDFGQINPVNNVSGVDNWNGGWFAYGDISNFAFNYAKDYYANSGVCSHVTVAIGINNSWECSNVGRDPNCVTQEGTSIAWAVNYAQNNVNTYNQTDLKNQLDISGADDIEMGDNSWDSYNLTKNYLNAYYQATSAYLWDYGIAVTCGNDNLQYNCGNGNTYVWDNGEIYNAAWGIGRDMVIPETYYSPYPWANVYNNTINGCADCYGGHMYFSGVMSESGWNDPAGQYSWFWSAVGVPAPSSFYYDTCMPTYHDDTTAPCY